MTLLEITLSRNRKFPSHVKKHKDFTASFPFTELDISTEIRIVAILF